MAGVSHRVRGPLVVSRSAAGERQQPFLQFSDPHINLSSHAALLHLQCGDLRRDPYYLAGTFLRHEFTTTSYNESPTH